MTATHNIAIRVGLEGAPEAKRGMDDLGESGSKALKKIHDATEPASFGLKALDAAGGEAQQVVQGFAEHAGRLGGILTELGPAGLIAAGAIGAVVFAMHHAVEAAEEFEQAQRKLDAVLQATGQAAGQSKAQLTELAETYASTTLYTAEQVQQSEAVLLTYKKIHSDVFDQALQATLDISTLFDKDLTASARAVGRALEDPVDGMKALQRVGVQLDPVMKANIKNLVDTGQQAAAQKVILDALAHSVGGQAESQNQGVTGATHAFSESLHEAEVALGRNIEDTGILQGVLNGLAGAFKSLREEIRPTAEEELKELDARMKLVKGMGNDTFLFGMVDNPAYTSMQKRRAELEDQQTKAEKDKEEAHNKEQMAIRQEHAEALLMLDEDLSKKLKEETQTEEQKILDETEAFKRKIRGQLLDDGSNKDDVEKELALADKLKDAKLDKINEKEAEAAQKLAEANQKVVDSLRQRVALEGIGDPRQKAVQTEVGKLGDTATAQQVAQTKQLAAALYDEQKAALDAKNAQQLHDQAIQKINQEILKTKPSFEVAKQALDDWKAKLIEDLGGATDANEKYIAEIEQIYTVRLKEIYNKSLQDSKDWEAGAARGLSKYADDATNAAKNSERVFTNAANKIEDALVDMVSKGKFSLKTLGDVVQSIEQDVLRSFIRENITGPIAGGLSSLLGGGAGGSSGGGGIFGSLFSSIFHEGGIVGETLSAQRMMPAYAFAGAPRFHSGLMPDEFPAILQKGETVIPKNKRVNNGMNITFNVSTPNAQSFMDSQGQIMSKLAGNLQRYKTRNG